MIFNQNGALQRYDVLDGLRAYAAIGIVIMHVRANSHIAVGGNL